MAGNTDRQADETLVLQGLKSLNVCKAPSRKLSSEIIQEDTAVPKKGYRHGYHTPSPPSSNADQEQVEGNSRNKDLLHSPPGAPRKSKKVSNLRASLEAMRGEPSRNVQTTLFREHSSAKCQCRSVDNCTCIKSPGSPPLESEGLCLLARRTDLKHTLVRGPSGFFKIATGLSLDGTLSGELLLPPNFSTGVRIAEDHNEFYIVRRGLLECEYARVRVQLNEGDIFAVPLSTCFEMKNICSTEAVISFFSTRSN